ncbi:hypothetical protein FGG08_006689 [Glutinoglossum americanum]|uniref:Uncharacterized protein n=1 Tax=Glutinoglossum americanum TaxID=1670608 RepID=A0A9P8I2Z3_9PEZI|nr:hypothetical protein FGG08_006689 [Glutinoglossum americanum]
MRLYTAQLKTPTPAIPYSVTTVHKSRGFKVKSNALSSLPSSPSSTTPTNRHAHNEPYDVHESHSQPSQLAHQHQQRQQQHSTRHSPQDAPRPSNSSGSVPHTLRRTPRLEEQHRGQRRAISIGAPEQRRPTVTFQEPPRELFEEPSQDQGSSTPRASLSQQHQSETLQPSYRPHPATRISRRTAAAILYALEEAIRTPYRFTPDLVEENASMADLLGGPSASGGGPGRGTSNGSGRAAGPVPVQQNPVVRGPREVWRDRQAREAKKKAESEASEREEERRRATERGTVPASGLATSTTGVDTVAGVAGGGREAGGESSGHRRASGNVPTPTSPPQGDRRYAERATSGGISRANQSASVQSTGQIPTAPRMQEPTTPSQAAHQTGRGGAQPRRRSVDPGQPVPVQQPQYTGAPSSSQQPPPPQPQIRPAAGAPPTSAQAQQGRSGPASGSQPTQAGPSTGGTSGRNPTVTSSFPHAFERWETLSSHWEGLTAYWIRRLEANREEVRREPLAQQMSRQITDLSAAGANLFHAVVELQRLRASSERKFQRWFFETRAEQERAQEVQGEMENTLRRERQQRADALEDVGRLERENANEKKLVAEMRRELQISKEEARRAWEELGRREQEERERTNSLRDGIPTLVGGVQVVPMTPGALSRHNSVNRPAPLDDHYQGAPVQPSARGQAGGEGTGEVPVSRAEGGGYEYGEGGQASTADDTKPGPPNTQPLPVGTYPSATNSVTAPSPTARGGSSSTPSRQRTSAPSGSSVPTTALASYQQSSRSQPTEPPSPSTRMQLYQHPGQSIGGQGTPAEDIRSESRPSEGYSEDEEYELDEQGNILLDEHGNRVVYRRGQHSDDSDDYDEEAEAHERAYMGRYGGASGVDYQMTTTGAGPVSPGWEYGDQDPAYSGAGYGWDYSQHHRPTRLSDVQEEDERSRTSASRASVASANRR